MSSISDLADRLRREIRGEVLFDSMSRGLYSTDASIYQIMPIGVVVPKNDTDVSTSIEICSEYGVPILARGAGTSQGGQAVGNALILDYTKYLNRLIELNLNEHTVTVEPGMVLDTLNTHLKPHGLFFPIDPSTASRATIGGMAGNNSCGARSIRYGNMVHNVTGIDGFLSDGTAVRFSDVPKDISGIEQVRYRDLVLRLRDLAGREQTEIVKKFPSLLRRVGGYNLDSIDSNGHNMARMLVGSEGTLAIFRNLSLALQPIPSHRVLGIAHFPTLYAAMSATKHIVALNPDAVELVDHTMIELAQKIPAYHQTLDHAILGTPEAVLLVEFSGENFTMLKGKLRELSNLLSHQDDAGPVVEAIDKSFIQNIWEVRKAGLNIMMSMKGDGKPISFIEDCAVSLDDLPEYTQKLNDLFKRHGTTGTWYAHASVGCLHVRPILNMKNDEDVRKMRSIAEETLSIVQDYKGSHSGEHGDGLVRSEFHETMFGSSIVRAFENVKNIFDPDHLLNPGKIVHAPLMDDRTLFRYQPGYTSDFPNTATDWTDSQSFSSAVEMCNNNGACRKNSGMMCPSFQATRDEKHSTRGRANALRLALSGQLGDKALTSPEVFDVLELCIGCKGCRLECPTGVDMTRMKTEFLHHYREQHGTTLRDNLFAHIPLYSPWMHWITPLLAISDYVPGVTSALSSLLRLTPHRPLPRWRGNASMWRNLGGGHEVDVCFFIDTFNRYFEPENITSALNVLRAGRYNVAIGNDENQQPLCCGRTYLSAGLVDKARSEAQRTLLALRPYVVRNIPIVGLEPACLLTLRDEFRHLVPGRDSEQLSDQVVLFEEFFSQQLENGKLSLPLKRLPEQNALLHAHCHQRAFNTLGALRQVLNLIPELSINTVRPGCCGMAGSFGYEREHFDISMRIGDLGPLPSIREATSDCLIIADGFSCRQQINHATKRVAKHSIRTLEMALDAH